MKSPHRVRVVYFLLIEPLNTKLGVAPFQMDPQI